VVGRARVGRRGLGARNDRNPILTRAPPPGRIAIEWDQGPARPRRKSEERNATVNRTTRTHTRRSTRESRRKSVVLQLANCNATHPPLPSRAHPRALDPLEEDATGENPHQAPSAHTHTHAQENLVLTGYSPHEPRTEDTTSHCHALVLLFCADMSRMLTSHTQPTPACIGTSVVRMPPPLHVAESPLSQALDPPHLGAVAGRFRHFSWLTLGARGS